MRTTRRGRWGGPKRDDVASENAMLSRLVTEAPRVPWDDFLDQLEWKNGEHFALIGPTGQGKTTMLTRLLPLHKYVAVFATKPRDESMDKIIYEGYTRLDHWRSLDPDDFPRRVIWPDASSLDSRANQKRIFKDAMERIYREGHWTLTIDELWYISNILNLTEEVKVYLLQARAMGISLLAATQRPSAIPVEVYDQSTHLMFWRDNDEVNLRRLSGIGWRSADLIREIVSNLEPYQVLYVNTRHGTMMRTRCAPVAELPRGGN